MDKVLSGKPLSQSLKRSTAAFIAEYNLRPQMLLLQVGNDPASEYYVQSIIKSGSKLGCEVELRLLPGSITQEDFTALISEANANPDINGIMIQRPLPKHIDEELVNSLVSPDKDIDCLNPINLGKIMIQADCLLPCTPAAVYLLLRYYEITTEGKHIVILGRSAVVGKPLANILLWKSPYANATVTVCHSRSTNLKDLTRQADILISAIGIPGYVQEDMLKDNAILIDVGINEVTLGDGSTSYVGDVDYNSCYSRSLAITPVPGGVGLVTTSVLFMNLVKATLHQKGINKNIDDFIAVNFDAK
ncbi:MAG TPA: bifunctional 5,10-methylenetetrahydrofolate dehydrogenase/5,10-methenyltetrahydrofolate cyclohydrolase [Candidatus Cloacimonadota bacterium]|nr:bifunctional 5,10-methylenetetrahydrofolate dehydrogenase/5,10-methenyltetrahydrofolate cyclohydrolase [Candidatus Cloacimonadota bacterium]HPS38915.1 bifunctional 5,10-methylenetetrahydrofolate dehydrogenase/5,10-methenyltetrahydrofolate cyclohydrolase [Candidatus Cloacimonadota bacterium]